MLPCKLKWLIKIEDNELDQELANHLFECDQCSKYVDKMVEESVNIVLKILEEI